MCASGSVPLTVVFGMVDRRWCQQYGRGHRAADASLLQGVGEDDFLNSTAELTFSRNLIAIVPVTRQLFDDQVDPKL